MSEEKDKKDIIAVTKNQALGVGGASVAITTIVALTSTFLTSDDGKLFQRQIDQNKASIQLLQLEIKEGFKEQGKALKEAVKDIEKVMRDAAKKSWTREDHERYSRVIDSRLDHIEDQLNDRKK
jgi:FtsZ-binding cell division protein ZapB